MEIKIKCPACGQKYDADESFVGQWITCQICGEQFHVDDIWKPTRCVHCKEWFEVTEYNQTVECPLCGEKTVAASASSIKAGDDAIAEKKQDRKRKIKRGFRVALIPILLLILLGVIVGKKIYAEQEQKKLRFVKGIIEKKIKENFKYPESADYIYDTQRKIPTEDNQYYFSGYVLAPNAFGVKSRYDFSVKIDLGAWDDENNDWYYPLFWIRPH